MTDTPIDLRKARLKRTNDAAQWTVAECIADLHERLSGNAPDYLAEADAVVLVFSKRFPDGSSQETIVQAGTTSGNETIGILTCGINIMTRPE